jgi:hypothetical protein
MTTRHAYAARFAGNFHRYVGHHSLTKSYIYLSFLHPAKLSRTSTPGSPLASASIARRSRTGRGNPKQAYGRPWNPIICHNLDKLSFKPFKRHRSFNRCSLAAICSRVRPTMFLSNTRLAEILPTYICPTTPIKCCLKHNYNPSCSRHANLNLTWLGTMALSSDSFIIILITVHIMHPTSFDSI